VSLPRLSFCALLVTGLLAGAQGDLASFQLRAKSTEGKILLGALHTAEKIYQVEHDTFSTDLVAIEAELQCTRYAVGFVVPSKDPGGKTHPGRMLADTTGVKDLTGKKPPETWAKWCPDCTAGEKGFRAIAVGNLGTADKPIWDVWTIDQDRKLTHVVDGTVAPH
jgi:hypothetical protein